MNKGLKVVLVNICIIGFAVGIVSLMNALYSEPEKSEISKPVQVDLSVGSIAPNFTGVDSNGKTHQLSEFKGKIVVLEWKNHLCPFVKKYYQEGHMQAIQKELTEQGVVWLSIISSAKGKQGHVSSTECNDIITKEKSFASAVILDSDSEIGRLYNAKTTPHMYVINKEGAIAYKGAIDSIRSANTADIKKADNYVVSAVRALQTNTPIATTETAPYGCSVKY